MNRNPARLPSPRLGLVLLALLGNGCQTLKPEPRADTLLPVYQALEIGRCSKPFSCTPVVGANRGTAGTLVVTGLGAATDLLVCRPLEERRWSERENRVVCVPLKLEAAR